MRGSIDGIVYHVAAPIRMAGKDYVADVMIKAEANMTRMYVHEVALREKLQQSVFKTGAVAAEAGKRAGSADVGAIRSILQSVYGVNSETVSKIVDENGEPMVVFHYSPTQGITEFLPFARDLLNGDKTRQEVKEIIERWQNQEQRGYMNFRAGTFFAPQRGSYASYGNAEYGVFLRAANPITKAGRKEATAPYADRPVDALMMDMEGDGTIREIAVFDPTQIKSATDNNGDFSENPSFLAS
jgi:hypothetical protein